MIGIWTIVVSSCRYLAVNIYIRDGVAAQRFSRDHIDVFHSDGGYVS